MIFEHHYHGVYDASEASESRRQVTKTELNDADQLAAPSA